MTQRSTLTDQPESITPIESPPTVRACSAADRRRLWTMIGLALVLVLCFSGSLLEWIRAASRSARYSHIFLVPFISAYLIWIRRDMLPRQFRTSPWGAVFALFLGVLCVVLHWVNGAGAWPVRASDRLALLLFSFYAFLVAGGFLLLGSRLMKAAAFPMFFLLFILPMPTVMENLLEVFFQHTSATAASWLFSLTGTTFFREGLAFQLPGMTIEVAQECSGINSSYVLFITSLIAGHLFLRSGRSRLLLATIVIPLAIARNAFRIVTISLLCVHVDPAMIHSWIHRKGGPVFFALSLVPFFLLLVWLRRWERGGEIGDRRSKMEDGGRGMEDKG